MSNLTTVRLLGKCPDSMGGLIFDQCPKLEKIVVQNEYFSSYSNATLNFNVTKDKIVSQSSI